MVVAAPAAMVDMTANKAMVDGAVPSQKMEPRGLPMLVSNLNNTTLTASISPLRLAPGQSAAMPPPPPVAGIQYTNAIAASS